MHEIDPQSDVRLTEALRRLAASSRQSAPPELGASLLTEFRRHHARRRLIRRIRIATLAACLCVVTGLAFMRAPRIQPVSEHTPEAAPSVPDKTPDGQVVAKIATAQSRPVGKRARPKAAAVTGAASRRQFLALPGYDPAVPADELHVVRVQLPASALWQMGAPVSPDLGGRKFLADFVVSQDGTPYAVRLVQ
jgi:hypothetical protein